jgi:hypothetical protein
VNKLSAQSLARVLTIAGALIGIGGYLTQPQNLAVLTPGQAHWVAAAGAVAYVIGQAVERTFIRSQVQENAKVIDTVVKANGLKKPDVAA